MQRLEYLSVAIRIWVPECVGVAVWRHIAPIDTLLGISVSSRGLPANTLLFQVTID